MKRLLPRRTELLILVIMALFCALVSSTTFHADAALSIGSMPLFVGACLMGMRRNGQLSRRD
jgi:hypothetical protein